MRSVIIAALALSLAAGLSAQAQSFQPNWAGWGSTVLGNQQLELVKRRSFAAHARAAASGTAPAEPSGAGYAAPSGPIVTSYRRDPQVTRQVVSRFGDYVGHIAGPEKAQVVRAELERRDFVPVWAASVAPYGYRPGDVVDALAAYWGLNWSVANGADVGASQAMALRRQIRAVLGRDSAFLRLTEADRQRMAEVYMVNFVYQRDVYVDAVKRGDRALQQQLATTAETRFRNEMHADLRSLALTDQGLAARR